MSFFSPKLGIDLGTANTLVFLPGKGIVKASWLFNAAPLRKVFYYPKIVRVKEVEVYLSGTKYVNQEGQLEYLIVASYDKPEQSLENYKERWQIETMFKAFKTAGFNLQSTHVTDYERLDRLLMLTALAFFWAYKVGIYKDKEIKTIKIKKHGRLEKSLFACGLECLAQALINTFQNVIKTLTFAFLSCT